MRDVGVLGGESGGGANGSGPTREGFCVSVKVISELGQVRYGVSCFEIRRDKGQDDGVTQLTLFRSPSSGSDPELDPEPVITLSPSPPPLFRAPKLTPPLLPLARDDLVCGRVPQRKVLMSPQR